MENRMFTMVKLAEMLTIYGKENYTIGLSLFFILLCIGVGSWF